MRRIGRPSIRIVSAVLMLAAFSIALSQSLSLKSSPPQSSSSQSKKESFWRKLLRIAGISATPSAQKGPADEATSGEIWVVQVAQSEGARLTAQGGYRSPIFLSGDQSILALRGDDAFEIPLAGGKPRKLFPLKKVVKLVGQSLDDPDTILVLIEGRGRRRWLGLLSLKSGQVSSVSYDRESEDFRRMLAHAEGWERVYGTSAVYIKTESKKDLAGSVEWTDVYLKRANSAPVNLSRCDEVNCGQPSLSQKGNLVVYVRSEQ